MLTNQPFNFAQIAAAKTVVRHEAHRVEPKFGFMLGGSHVNVRRLLSFVAEEKKPVTPNSQDTRHNEFPTIPNSTSTPSVGGRVFPTRHAYSMSAGSMDPNRK